MVSVDPPAWLLTKWYKQVSFFPFPDLSFFIWKMRGVDRTFSNAPCVQSVSASECPASSCCVLLWLLIRMFLESKMRRNVGLQTFWAPLHLHICDRESPQEGHIHITPGVFDVVTGGLWAVKEELGAWKRKEFQERIYHWCRYLR